MHLSRRSVLLVGIVSLLGCTDTSGPKTISALYDLQNINGRPLPTYFTTSGPTIVSGTLMLDKSGGAILTETQEVNGVQSTNARTYTYSIENGTIHFELSPPCPINANCVAAPIGTISGNTISLVVAQVSIDGEIVYNFKTAPTL